MSEHAKNCPGPEWEWFSNDLEAGIWCKNCGRFASKISVVKKLNAHASLTEKVERLEGENKRTSQGWVCPKCGSVYAIWVAQCSICRPKVVAADTTDWQLG